MTGYFQEINYTAGYYVDLSPVDIVYNLTLQDHPVERIVNACEIGFGMGISLCAHAAASNIQWTGIELNQSQARYAQTLVD